MTAVICCVDALTTVQNMARSNVNDPSPLRHQYDYRPRRWQTVALFLLALAGTVILTYFAFFQDGPINVRGVRLTQLQARLLYGIFAILSPIGLFCLGGMVYVAFACDRRIALTDKHLILPRPTRMGLSRDEIQIPLHDVIRVSIHEFIGRTKLLRLDHTNGTINIPSNMLQSRAEFDDVCRAVQQAVDRATNRRITTPSLVQPRRSINR